ncbi:hypothetical protein EDC01DRAFT_776714 [Geopyxis carbonaria]|nr:hypothetical protein EDC01DRAFT_776714 [Geopyxis carbonaria]
MPNWFARLYASLTNKPPPQSTTPQPQPQPSSPPSPPPLTSQRRTGSPGIIGRYRRGVAERHFGFGARERGCWCDGTLTTPSPPPPAPPPTPPPPFSTRPFSTRPFSTASSPPPFSTTPSHHTTINTAMPPSPEWSYILHQLAATPRALLPDLYFCFPGWPVRRVSEKETAQFRMAMENWLESWYDTTSIHALRTHAPWLLAAHCFPLTGRSQAITHYIGWLSLHRLHLSSLTSLCPEALTDFVRSTMAMYDWIFGPGRHGAPGLHDDRIVSRPDCGGTDGVLAKFEEFARRFIGGMDEARWQEFGVLSRVSLEAAVGAAQGVQEAWGSVEGSCERRRWAQGVAPLLLGLVQFAHTLALPAALLHCAAMTFVGKTLQDAVLICADMVQVRSDVQARRCENVVLLLMWHQQIGVQAALDLAAEMVRGMVERVEEVVGEMEAGEGEGVEGAGVEGGGVDWKDADVRQYLNGCREVVGGIVVYLLKGWTNVDAASDSVTGRARARALGVKIKHGRVVLDLEGGGGGEGELTLMTNLRTRRVEQ